MKSRANLFFAAIVVLAAAGVIFLAGCATVSKRPSPQNSMVRVWSFFYPDFSDDLDYDGLAGSIFRSLAYLQKLPADRMFAFGSDSYRVAHLIRSLQKFSAYIQTGPSSRELQDFIHANYRVYRSVGRRGSGSVLFTGYYEPHLKGSARPGPEYSVPVYARPQDLLTIDLTPFGEKYKGEQIIGRLAAQTVVPYYDRMQIEADDVLKGKAAVLAWVQDPLDVFFLQVQGSGKIYLDDGRVINVHYDVTNGKPYRSIGKLLVDEEKIPREQVSMQAIRDYLKEHPEQTQAVLNHNPSYVFFKTETEGPLGYLEVKLTPGRSIALDRRIFPPAALAFIETQKPLVDARGTIEGWREFSRFVLNQDTGGAIRGPGRADLFWGSGPYAEIAAGHLQHEGRLYFLVLKAENPGE